MSDQVNTAFVQQYANNVQHLLQQRGSKLRDAVTTSTATGKAAKAVEQVGAVNAVKRTTRHGDTPLISTPHDARWVFPVDYEWADLIDDQDRIRMLINPQSPYAVNGAYALGRAIDDEIIGALYATAKTGENGTGTEAWSGQTLTTDDNQKMSLDGLLAAREKLMAAEVDIENDPIYCAISAQQHSDLLNLDQARSVDYVNKKVMVDGVISQFLGINFIVTERLPVDTNNDRRCFMWAKSGMHLCTWNDITTKISEREDKSYATQVYCNGTFGATRLELQKVVEMKVHEA